jgi:hypothetical protein
LGVSENAIRTWNRRELMPAPVSERGGPGPMRHTRWASQEIKQWIAAGMPARRAWDYRPRRLQSLGEQIAEAETYLRNLHRQIAAAQDDLARREAG